MLNRTAASHPHHTGAYGQVFAAVLFAAALLFGLLVMLRYAHGWAEVASEGAAATIPMIADGLVAIVSAAVTAAGAVWLYARQIAR